jgi:hypothetical protein
MAYDIAQLIRDTIEPDIWLENGGQYGTIRYYDGRLIVSAAPFVQRQIGSSVPGRQGYSSRQISVRPFTTRRSTSPAKRFRSSGVSGVQGRSNVGVSGVQGRSR